MVYYKKAIFKINIIVLLLAIFITGGIPKVSLAAGKANLEDKEKKTILIDPGHGGIDGGAVSQRGTVEKDINLSISLKIRDELKKNGFNVIMTRDSDVGLYSQNGKIRDKKREDLKNRCLLKEKSGSDMFLSIHQNMFPQSQYYGAQVWYSKTDESKILAHLIQENFKTDLKDGNKRVEKQALEEYRILRCAPIPSVIVECGFLSNSAEEAKLKTEEYQMQIAKSIVKSVTQYFSD